MRLTHHKDMMLPVVELAATSSAQPAEPAINNHPAILVVEDDPAIRRLLEALLGSAGYEVRTAMDGAEALAACAEHRPGVVFLDVTLPHMSGWQVLAQLRARADAPPVVLLTGDSAAARRAHQAGATAAILKPFDIDQVLDLAAQLLGTPPAD